MSSRSGWHAGTRHHERPVLGPYCTAATLLRNCTRCTAAKPPVAGPLYRHSCCLQAKAQDWVEHQRLDALERREAKRMKGGP